MKTLLITLMLANASDAALTMRNFDRPGFQERNPVMRPLFKNRAAIGTAFSIDSAFQVLAVHKYGRKHDRLVKLGLGALLGDEAWGVETSSHSVRRP